MKIGLYGAGGFGREVFPLIGEKLMEALKVLDPVAYIRFASVYRSFGDVESFQAELAELRSK